MPIKASDVLRLADKDGSEIVELLARFDLRFRHCANQEPIPGSYWGDEEAGLKANNLYARDDTPLHSILHETCHYICVDPERRRLLDTNAGSDEAEENAVCYLQILLADEIDSLGREHMFNDMDNWGYSFRLGSSRAWFEEDSDDALDWLITHNLLDSRQRPRLTLRQTPGDQA